MLAGAGRDDAEGGSWLRWRCPRIVPPIPEGDRGLEDGRLRGGLCVEKRPSQSSIVNRESQMEKRPFQLSLVNGQWLIVNGSWARGRPFWG